MAAGPKFWSLRAQAPDRQTETDDYVITWTHRPPMRDAGVKRRQTVTGWTSTRAAQRAIRESHGAVLRTERRRRWFR